MDNKVEVSREIAEWAQAKMAWDMNPRIRGMAKDLRTLLDGASVVKRQEPLIAESPAMAVLRAELERIRSLNHNQILAESVGRHLLNSNAKNYVGEVFTIELDDGSAQFEVVVTTQIVGGKSPHDLLQASEQRNADLVELLREAYKYPLEHACATGSWPAQELCERIGAVIKPTESDASNDSQLATTFAGAEVLALGVDKAAKVLDDIVEKKRISFDIHKLNLMDPSTVVDMIRDEHPQVITTILACLDKVQMANILELLDEKTRNDQLMRIFKLNGTNPLDGKGQESK